MGDNPKFFLENMLATGIDQPMYLQPEKQQQPQAYFNQNQNNFSQTNMQNDDQSSFMYAQPMNRNVNQQRFELPELVSYSFNSFDWERMKSHVPRSFDILQRGNLPSIITKNNNVVLETIDYNQIVRA